MKIPDDLYRQICRVMPIPCVDLLVSDERGRILLVRRRNEPARDQWWFPGGRVHFGETREAAVHRKLKEECGLTPTVVEEIGSFDLLFDALPDGGPTHAITTLFHVRVTAPPAISLDGQSAEAQWRGPDEWIQANVHPFVRDSLRRAGDAVFRRG